MTYEEFKEKVGSVILTDDGNCPVTPVIQMLQGKWKPLVRRGKLANTDRLPYIDSCKVKSRHSSINRHS